MTDVPPLRRADLYPRGVVDGRAARNGGLGRFGRQVDSLRVSRGERTEADVERDLRAATQLTRPNVVATVSPKGGVGKTTSTFLLGNLIASHVKLRVVAVDPGPGFGTLGRLPDEPARSHASVAELLDHAEHVGSSAELRRYMSLLPSGLHVLATDHGPSAELSPRRYGELLALLSCFYEVVLLDLSTGLTGPVTRLTLDRADQVVLVSTPESMAATLALASLDQLGQERVTFVVNEATPNLCADPVAVDAHLSRSVTIPYDERLAVMLDTGTYSLEALDRDTRLPIKQLALAVAQQLV